jgi:hypothetical protein
MAISDPAEKALIARRAAAALFPTEMRSINDVPSITLA